MTTQEIIQAVADAAQPGASQDGAYTATEALAITSDYAQFPTDTPAPPRVVAVDDPDAAVLLVPEGGKLPKAVADALGLKAKKGIVSTDSAPSNPPAPTVVSQAVPQDEPAPPPPLGSELPAAPAV